MFGIMIPLKYESNKDIFHFQFWFFLCFLINKSFYTEYSNFCARHRKLLVDHMSM